MFPLCTDVSGNFFLYAIKQAWSGHQLISALWGEVIHIYPVLGLCSSYSHSITQMFILMDWHRFPLNCTKDYIQHHVLFCFVFIIIFYFSPLLLQTIIPNNPIQKFIKLHLQKISTVSFHCSSEDCYTTLSILIVIPDG